MITKHQLWKFSHCNALLNNVDFSDSVTARQTDAILPNRTAPSPPSSSSSPSSSPTPPSSPPLPHCSTTSALPFYWWWGQFWWSQHIWCAIFWCDWKSWCALFWGACTVFWCCLYVQPGRWWAQRSGVRTGPYPNSKHRRKPHQLALYDRVESIQKFKFRISVDDAG